MGALRPDLFNRLNTRRRFGGVIVANEGEPLRSTVTVSDGRKSRTVQEWGEAYRVNCPFCSDTRHRLYVNHRWGLFDGDTGARNWWLCHCYNEDCLHEFANQMKLRDMVYDDAVPPTQAECDKLVVVKAKGPVTPIALPGYCVEVTSLGAMHPVNVYLASRQFAHLAEPLGLRYCVFDASGKLGATDRLVIPMYMKDKLVTWQARWLDLVNPVNGNPPKGVPKYLTCPGSHKAQVLYNYDSAIRYGGTLPVLEGPTDVWRFGPEAAGTLGKGVSLTQAQLICYGWPAVILVVDNNDPDAETKAVRAVTEFRRNRFPAAYVKTPAGTDPGGMSTADLRKLAGDAAAAAGLPPIGGLKVV